MDVSIIAHVKGVAASSLTARLGVPALADPTMRDVSAPPSLDLDKRRAVCCVKSRTQHGSSIANACKCSNFLIKVPVKFKVPQSYGEVKIVLYKLFIEIRLS